MNNLSYSSQKPEEIAAKVEEIVRADLGASQPVPYRIVPGEAGGLSVGSFFADSFKALTGGKSACLLSVVFDRISTRPASLEVRMDRQGVGCHAGTLVFAAPLSRAVSAPIVLEDPKFFGKSKFKGDDAQAAGKLNANADLIKRANAFARTEGNGGGLKLEIKRCFQIVPNQGTAQLVAMTLARITKMGLSASTDANEFLGLLDLIDKTI